MNNTDIKVNYKIGDKVECVNGNDKVRYIGKNNNYGTLSLRSIKKDGSLGEIIRGWKGRKDLKGLNGRIIDIVGEKLIVGFLPHILLNEEPHPYFYSYNWEGEYGTEYGYYNCGVECSPYNIELINNDFKIRKLEEEINIKEEEIEELKQQIETINKEVVSNV